MRNVVLDKNSSLGESVVFLMIPFSLCDNALANIRTNIFTEWYIYEGAEDVELNSIKCLKKDSKNSLLRQFLTKDCEVYAEKYSKKHPFFRGIVEDVEYVTDDLKEIKVKILITCQEDGFGTITMINTFSSNTIEVFLESVTQLKSWQKQMMFVNKKVTSITEFVKALFGEGKYDESNTEAAFGEEYPFFSIGASELEIVNIDEFVENNKPLIYGLLYQDYKYDGWERMRKDILDDLLDKNISRRKECSIYISDKASVEIDSDERISFIEKWAKIKKTSTENMKLKLLFERVQLLEILLIQKFILLKIENSIEAYEGFERKKVGDLLELKKNIARALADYYYANAMSNKHAYGIEWVNYGKERFGLHTLFEHIKNRVELVESNQQIKNDFNNMRGGFVFQLISIILGSTTITNLVDFMTEIPNRFGLWVDVNILNVKGGLYVVFLILVIIITMRYYRDR